MKIIITRKKERIDEKVKKLHSFISYQEYYYFSIIVMAPVSLFFSSPLSVAQMCELQFKKYSLPTISSK